MWDRSSISLLQQLQFDHNTARDVHSLSCHLLRYLHTYSVQILWLHHDEQWEFPLRHVIGTINTIIPSFSPFLGHLRGYSSLTATHSSLHNVVHNRFNLHSIGRSVVLRRHSSADAPPDPEDNHDQANCASVGHTQNRSDTLIWWYAATSAVVEMFNVMKSCPSPFANLYQSLQL